MARTIFVLEQGEYSDYSVVGVFSSREKAALVQAAMKTEYDEPSIAEWPLDPAVSELSQGLSQWTVMMHRDGRVERCIKDDEVRGYNLAGSVALWQRTKAPAYKGRSDIDDLLQTTVWAKDEKHAIKITNEHRSEWIANGKWPV